MRPLYFVLPLAVTAGFSALYLPSVNDIEAAETAKVEAKAEAERQAAAKQRADLEAAKAKEIERRAQRVAEEKAAEEKLATDHLAATAALKVKLKTAHADRDAADRAFAEAAKNTEAARLERLAAQEKVFQARKDNELQRIAIRSAELNSQRLLDMLATKAGANLSPAPATPTATSALTK